MELLHLDLHSKLFTVDDEWFRIGPLRIYLFKGHHLEIVSSAERALVQILEILLGRDSNWLGTLRFAGYQMSGAADGTLSSLGVGILGSATFHSDDTVRSVILRADGPLGEDRSSLTDAMEVEKIAPAATVHSLGLQQRQWLNLRLLISGQPSLVIIQGDEPIVPNNRELAARVIGRLMAGGCSFVTLSSSADGAELAPRAPRVFAPVERVSSHRRGFGREESSGKAWWVA